MTCAKVRVQAVLITQNRGMYIGENLCDRPQGTCPRVEGEGYDKCKSVCFQPMHAEMHAIDQCKKAGDCPIGGTIFVKYKYVCEWCQQALRHYNIEVIRCDFSC